MWRKLLLALPAFTFLLLVGCGAGGSTVTGQVNFGTTAKPSGEDKINLTMADGKNTYSSEVDPAGNFKFENVPEGSYVVTIIKYKVAPTGGDAKPGKPPTGPGAPEMKTYPDNFKVPGGPYTIDMAKITPTKK